MFMAALVFAGFLLLGDAAEAHVPVTCYVLGEPPEFPISPSELIKHRTRLDKTTGRYRTVADLPLATLRVSQTATWRAQSSSQADAATYAGMMKLSKRVKELSTGHAHIDDAGRLGDHATVTISGRTYELQEYLGQGFAAEVYRAVQRGDVEGKSFAVKLSKKPADEFIRMHGQDFLNREILREYNTMLFLDAHAQIPTVHGIARLQSGPESGTVMVSDYIGTDLSSLVNRGILNLEDTLHYGIKLVRALEHLHSEFRLIHRDIKPANIVIKDAGTGFVKDNDLFLIDLGSAVPYISLRDGMHTPNGANTGFVGTERYMSPRARANLSQGRLDDMFAALLVIMRSHGLFGLRNFLLRGNSDAPGGPSPQSAALFIPSPFVKVWDATYKPVLRDATRWKDRPPYELVIRVFEDELARIVNARQPPQHIRHEESHSFLTDALTKAEENTKRGGSLVPQKRTDESNSEHQRRKAMRSSESP